MRKVTAVNDATVNDATATAQEPSGVRRFRAAMEAKGTPFAVVSMQERTHTAQEAAAAVGCPVGAIVKSLVFLADADPILVLVSGPNLVDLDVLGATLGATISKADARGVKEFTGYSIGGVPPFGHPTALRTIVDQDLLEFPLLWAASGAATSVFSIEPTRLLELTDGTVTKVS